MLPERLILWECHECDTSSLHSAQVFNHIGGEEGHDKHHILSVQTCKPMGPSAVLSALFLTLLEMWSSGICPSGHLLKIWSEIGKD